MKTMRRYLYSTLRSIFLWRNPLRHSLPFIADYEIIRSIHGTNQLYLIRIGKEKYYFRVMESTISSIASICRSLGTEEMGRLLGLQRLHPKCMIAELSRLGPGILQTPAAGFNIMPYSEPLRVQMLTPTFQREINNLNILDALCYETDHSPNNYNVTVMENGNLSSLSVFDNNGRGTFACRGSLSFSTYKKISPIVTPDGYVNRPHLSRETTDNLQHLSFCKLYIHMRKYLKALPILFIQIRIARLKRAIRKSSARDPSFLLEENEWSSETLLQELSGSFGKTYLLGFLQDCVPPKS